MSADGRAFLAVTLPFAWMNLINQASRTVMAVIGPALAVEFALSASELGLLAACMFAAYAIVQLPGGVAIDWFGPRRVQSLVERYDTLYSACRADVDEIAALPGMNRSLAEKVRQALS